MAAQNAYLSRNKEQLVCNDFGSSANDTQSNTRKHVRIITLSRFERFTFVGDRVEWRTTGENRISLQNKINNTLYYSLFDILSLWERFYKKLI